MRNKESHGPQESMHKTKQHAHAYAKSSLELIIREKAKRFVEAEKQYWNEKNSLREQMRDATARLSLKAQEALPSDVSSTIWGLKDGVAFVRYKISSRPPRVEFRVLPITLDEWAETLLVIPSEQGEISLARAGIKARRSTFVNCLINGFHVQYAALAEMKYGDTLNTPTVERAIIDFQLTLLGLQTQERGNFTGRLTDQGTILRLEAIGRDFEKLLEGESREEDLQKFLKDNSFVLHPSAESIPKQKLGEDFVTDFVLVSATTQGPSYVLVELERSNHPVLTKDFALSSPVAQAIKQTRDWDVWLESNKAYVKNKLPGFETPRYVVVIGRSKDFSADQSAYLRSYNREWKNLELVTYDDVLYRFRATVEKLKSTIAD